MAKKKTGNFYGSPIKNGALHKAMGIPVNKNIPLTKMKTELKRIEAKKNKTAADKLMVKRLTFAINARKFKKGK